MCHLCVGRRRVRLPAPRTSSFIIQPRRMLTTSWGVFAAFFGSVRANCARRMEPDRRIERPRIPWLFRFFLSACFRASRSHGSGPLVAAIVHPPEGSDLSGSKSGRDVNRDLLLAELLCSQEAHAPAQRRARSRSRLAAASQLFYAASDLVERGPRDLPRIRRVRNQSIGRPESYFHHCTTTGIVRFSRGRPSSPAGQPRQRLPSRFASRIRLPSDKPNSQQTASTPTADCPDAPPGAVSRRRLTSLLVAGSTAFFAIGLPCFWTVS